MGLKKIFLMNLYVILLLNDTRYGFEENISQKSACDSSPVYYMIINLIFFSSPDISMLCEEQ